jgi:ribosomal protein S6E (S10)
MVAYNNTLYVFGGDDGYVSKSSGLRKRKIVIVMVISDRLIISRIICIIF